MYFQEENSVELVDRRHIDSYMNDSITKQNSFLFVTLSTLDGESIATNFLLLDKIKNSDNITNPNLVVSFYYSITVMLIIIIVTLQARIREEHIILLVLVCHFPFLNWTWLYLIFDLDLLDSVLHLYEFVEISHFFYPDSVGGY